MLSCAQDPEPYIDMNPVLTSILINSSPSPLTISAGEYLDALYGPRRAVIISPPVARAHLTLRTFGSPVPPGSIAYHTIPILIEGLDVNNVTPKQAQKRFDWSYAAFFFDAREEHLLLVEDIVGEKVPVMSVLSLAGKQILLVLRFSSQTQHAWQREVEKWYSHFDMIDLMPDPPEWTSPSVLPNESDGVTLLYFNPGLSS